MDRVLSGAALEMKTRCIEMTPFYHCKKAELPDTKGGAPIRAAVGNAPTGGLLLTLPRDVELPLRTPIEVTFYDPLLGVVRCRCSLFAPLPAGEMRSYRCEVLEQLSQTQRREDLKISLSAKVAVSYNGGHWPATIYNISARPSGTRRPAMTRRRCCGWSCGPPGTAASPTATAAASST